MTFLPASRAGDSQPHFYIGSRGVAKSKLQHPELDK